MSYSLKKNKMVFFLCNLLLFLYLFYSFTSNMVLASSEYSFPNQKGTEQSEMVYQSAKSRMAGKLHAQAAVVMDGKSGRVLYEKNGDTELANASTTKILTCILILERGNLDDVAEASAFAARQPKVHLGMKEGQKFYVRDLLYALMLESYNDCAVVLAEYLCDSVEAFAKEMNEKAIEIGCEHTHFVTPNGLDGKDEEGSHHTTAVDLSKIMQYCVMISPEREQFLTITQANDYHFTDADGKNHYQCNNHNSLLRMYDGVISGKTGFTGNAGYCYTAAAKQGEETRIVSVLACGWPPSKNYKWQDTKELLDYSFSFFESVSLSGLLCELPEIPLELCKEESLAICQNGELYSSVNGEERLLALCRIPVNISETMDAGTEVGAVDYYAGGEYLGSIPIVAKNDVVKWQYNDYLRHLCYRLFQ